MCTLATVSLKIIDLRPKHNMGEMKMYLKFIRNTSLCANCFWSQRSCKNRLAFDTITAASSLLHSFWRTVYADTQS